MARSPRCPYQAEHCPGSSDEAWRFFDEDLWALAQWMCQACHYDFHIANHIPFDEEDDLAA